MVFKEYFIDTLSKKLVNYRSRRSKVFLKILQKSQENTCVGVSYLVKLQSTCNFIKKKRLRRRCFPVNFAKYLWTTFFNRTPPIAASVIAQQRFVGLQEVLKTSWRHVLKTSSARLQRNNFSSSKTSWRCLEDFFARRLEDVWLRRIYSSEDVWVRRIYSSWSRPLEDVFWRQRQKTSSRRLHQDECSLGGN